jgi:hypothetical protein
MIMIIVMVMRITSRGHDHKGAKTVASDSPHLEVPGEGER